MALASALRHLAARYLLLPCNALMKTPISILPLLLAIVLTLAATAESATISLGYDAAGRLTSATFDGTSRTAYSYDKNGNLLSRANTHAPVAPMAGTFNGLLTDPTPELSTIGPITLKIATSGTFSGKVSLAGVSYAFTGTFPATGIAPTITIDRKPPLNDLILDLALDVINGTQRVTGELTDTVFTSVVQLDRIVYNTTTQLLPAGFVGPYTALLMPTEVGAGIPTGDGYATVNVSASGTVMLAGKLANSVGITYSAPIVGTGTWPIHISLHAGKGALNGAANFVNNPGVSDIAATLLWFKPPTSGAYHPAVIATELTFVGSRYVPPTKGQRVLRFANTAPNGTFTATDGNLAGNLTVDFTLDEANKIIVPAHPSKLKLSITTTTGLLSGSFLDGTKTRTLGGVVYQDQNVGSGFFPGPTVSGLIQLDSKP